MIPTIYTVTDALTLRVCRTDKFKAGMLSLSALLPIERDKVWMTSLLLAVLKRGTEKYPTLEAVNRRLDYLYGTDVGVRNFYRGDCQVIGFSAEILEGAYLPEGEDLLADVLEVISQMLFHPLTDENGLLLSRYVESEKQVQCDAIRAQKNHPRSYAAARASELLYQNEPYGAPLLGTVEEVSAVTAEELTAHWRALVDRISLDCFYVGATEPARVCEALAETVGRELNPNAVKIAYPIPSTVIRRAEEVRTFEEPSESAQSHLLMGFRTGCAISDPDYDATMVFNELFGASPISKLFVNVRERLSLCYYCSSVYNARKGTVMVRSGLSAQNRCRAEEEILAQLRAIAEGDFTDAELAGAKQSLVNVYRQAEDSPGALENIYFGRAISGVNVSLEEGRARILSVTREDVTRAAARMTLDTVYFLSGVGGEEDEDEEN